MPSPVEWPLRDAAPPEQGALLAAILRQGNKEVKSLVQAGAPLHAEFLLNPKGTDVGNGLDLLMLHKRYELVMQLLKLEESPLTEIARSCRRAVAWAAREGRTPILRELLLCSADPLQQDAAGRSALLLAALRGHGQCVNNLLEFGALDQETNSDEVQKWAVHWKLDCPLNEMRPQIQPESSKALETVAISEPVVPKPSPASLHAALHRAITRHGVQEVKELVQCGAPLTSEYDLDDLGKETGTALDLALMHKRYDLSLFLAKLEGQTGQELVLASSHALLCSAKDGRVPLVKELLRRSADLTHCDKENRSALHLAACRGRKECLMALLEAGAWEVEASREEVRQWMEKWKFQDVLSPNTK